MMNIETCLDIENQLKEIHIVLDEFKNKLKFFDIVPKPKIIEEEFKLTNKLMRYDNSVLVFTANEIECGYNPTRSSAKKTILTLLRYIGVLPL